MAGWLRRLGRRVRALRHGSSLDDELSDEIRFHIEMEAAELARTRGLSPEEARRQAVLGFGGVSRVHEEHRDARGVRTLEDLGQDIRYALRTLRRSPGFTAAAALVMALGIGSATAAFTAVDAVLLARLPFPQDDRLVRVFQQNSPTNRWGISAVDWLAIDAQQRSFSDVGAVQRGRAPVSVAGEPQRIEVGRATSGYLRALGVRIAHGRPLQPGDERLGAPPVAVADHGWSTRTFGAAERALGKVVTIDGMPHTVVGVLAPVPMGKSVWRAELWPGLQVEPPERRGPFFFNVIGRLAPGVTLEDARRDLAGISQRIFPEWAAGFQDSTARLTPHPLRAVMLTGAGDTLAPFSAAVGLVLLVAVANVASLMLVRATGRRREVGVRRTLGATRGRLVRLLVTESVLLSAAGALLGLLLGVFALKTLAAVAPNLPRLDEAAIGVRAALFAIALAVASGAIVGAYPVLLLSRQPVATDSDGARAVGAGPRASSARGAFVAAQFALALPLLAGAGLLLLGFLRLQRVDPGFDGERTLSIHVALPSARYPDSLAIGEYWRKALARLQETPGVVDAGLSQAVPPNDLTLGTNNFDLVARPVPAGTAQPQSPWIGVTAGFFDAMDVQLLEGRSFTPADTTGAPEALVVSRAWARRYFPDGTAVGGQLVSGGCVECPHTTIVGVVSDVRFTGLEQPSEEVYYSLTQAWDWASEAHVFVRTTGAPAAAIPAVREALRSVDPSVPLDDAAPVNDRVYASLAQPRHWTLLLAGFAVAALALAAVGIFGMLSYTVRTRRREIGVRIALGAQPRAVVRTIVRRGMAYAVGGAVLGLAAAAGGTRILGGAFFDLGPTDPRALAAVTLLLLIVALVASWLPARRAAHVPPVEALRLE